MNMSTELLLGICGVLLTVIGFLLAGIYNKQNETSKKVQQLVTDVAVIKTNIEQRDEICELKHKGVDEKFKELLRK